MFKALPVFLLAALSFTGCTFPVPPKSFKAVTVYENMGNLEQGKQYRAMLTYDLFRKKMTVAFYGEAPSQTPIESFTASYGDIEDAYEGQWLGLKKTFETPLQVDGRPGFLMKPNFVFAYAQAGGYRLNGYITIVENGVPKAFLEFKHYGTDLQRIF